MTGATGGGDSTGVYRPYREMRQHEVRNTRTSGVVGGSGSTGVEPLQNLSINRSLVMTFYEKRAFRCLQVSEKLVRIVSHKYFEPLLCFQ